MALGKSFSWIRQFPLKKDFRRLGREESPFPCQGEHSWCPLLRRQQSKLRGDRTYQAFATSFLFFPNQDPILPSDRTGPGVWSLLPAPVSPPLPILQRLPSFYGNRPRMALLGGQGQYCWKWRRRGWQGTGIESKEQEVSSSHSQVGTETC